MKTYESEMNVLAKGDTSIGAATHPDRKHPCIIVKHGAFASVYGYFKNAECAKLFMHELAELVGAKMDGGAEDEAENT